MGDRMYACHTVKGENIEVEVVSPHFVDPDGSGYVGRVGHLESSACWTVEACRTNEHGLALFQAQGAVSDWEKVICLIVARSLPNT